VKYAILTMFLILIPKSSNIVDASTEQYNTKLVSKVKELDIALERTARVVDDLHDLGRF
jgi:hypothetical protein